MLSRRRPVLCPTVIRAWNCQQGGIEAVVGRTIGRLKVLDDGFTLNDAFSVHLGLNPLAGTQQANIEASNPDVPVAPPGFAPVKVAESAVPLHERVT